jgi:hypothetical protein
MRSRTIIFPPQRRTFGYNNAGATTNHHARWFQEPRRASAAYSGEPCCGAVAEPYILYPCPSYVRAHLSHPSLDPSDTKRPWFLEAHYDKRVEEYPGSQTMDSKSKLCRHDSYRSYVKALCLRNPSLKNLDRFMSDPNGSSYGCSVAALDFLDGVCHPKVRSKVDVAKLNQEFHENKQLRSAPKLQGRILLIEDLTRDVVEMLGLALDIDPLFFAMHLHVISRAGIRHQTPDQATLPSRFTSQNFINTSYHRAITCGAVSVDGGRFKRDTVIDRKLIFLPSTTIGLVQHCVSIIRAKPHKMRSFWLGEFTVHHQDQHADSNSPRPR